MSILSSKKIKWTILSLSLVVLVGIGVYIRVLTVTGAIKQIVNADEFGIAIQGYDTVAYHLEKRAVKGKSEFAVEWNDAVWHFASSENRDLFAADPDRYAPQYGGYWARSIAALGRTAGINPQAFKIVGGKLYLSRATDSRSFEMPAKLIQKADRKWTKALEKFNIHN